MNQEFEATNNKTLENMANERITEGIVRDHFKSDPLFKSVKWEEQKSNNKRIAELLKGESKGGGKGNGYPEFIISFPTNSNYLIVVECKAKTNKHRSDKLDNAKDYAVDGVLHYAKALSSDFNVIAIAVSGENETELLVSHFYFEKNTRDYSELPILKLNDLTSSKSKVVLNDDMNNYIHNRNINININIKRNKKKAITTVERSKKRLKKVGFTKKAKGNLIYEDTEKEPNTIDNYNELTYKKALKFDKRNICQIFGNRILDRIELINILRTKKIKEIYLSKYFLFLLIDVTMNALFLSDYVISYKFHHNGKIDFNIILVITICSNILSLFIEHYLSLLIMHEKVIEKIKEIKQEEIFLNICKHFFKIVLFQIIIFFILSIIFLLFCIYYLVIFCNINCKTQKILVQMYLISLAESILMKLIISLIVTCSRKLGINFKNEYFYNTSKYIDNYI